MGLASMVLERFEARVYHCANLTPVASKKRETLKLKRHSCRDSWPVFTNALCSHSLVDHLHVNMSFEPFVLLAEMTLDMGGENDSLTSKANKGLETTIDQKTPSCKRFSVQVIQLGSSLEQSQSIPYTVRDHIPLGAALPAHLVGKEQDLQTYGMTEIEEIGLVELKGWERQLHLIWKHEI